MRDIDLEAVRRAMFADPGVKAVGDDLRLFHAVEGGVGVAATVSVAAPDVDQELVRRVVAAVMQEQFGISEVDLIFQDPGAPSAVSPEARGPLEKK